MPSQNKVTTRGPRQRPPKPLVTTSDVEFHSVLRVRPLLKKEKDDHIVLEPAKKQDDNAAIAVLHPMAHLSSPEPSLRLNGNLSSPKFIQEGRQEDYHFDKILDMNSSQDNVYYSTGLNMATDAMEPLKKNANTTLVHNHLALVMGVSNAGKTHTTFGNLKELGRPGRHEEDGLVPRILESLFSQSKHHVNRNKSFAVRMTLLHVENDKVHDLLLETTTQSQRNLATPPSAKKKSGVMAMVASLEGGASAQKIAKEVKIEQDPATHDYIPDATVKTCWSSSEARELLQAGLNRGLSSKFGGLAKGHSRGHTLITIQPIIIRGSRRDSTAVDRCGGTITFLDMAGIERAKKSRAAAGGAMRDSIANNSSFSAVQHVLRTIKHNRDVSSGKISSDVVCGDEDTFDGSEISCVSEPKVSKAATLKAVPYRQSKVTMLLQPLFSNTGQWNLEGKKTTTVVTTVLTAYPGHRDYVEKRSLLNDLQLLLGSDIAKRMNHTANTGLDTPAHVDGDTGKSMDDTSEETSSLEMSDDDDGEDMPHSKHPPPFRSPPVPPIAPSAPSQGYDVGTIPISVEEVPAPLPPPYAPGSQPPIVLEASAPPIDEVYPSANTPLMSTPVESSPALFAPTLSQRRTCVVDLPGVTLPAKASASPAISSTTICHSTPKIVKHTHTVESAAIAETSPGYTSPPLSTSLYKSSAAKASVSATPNIKPPKQNPSNKENMSSAQQDSPSRNWKDTSPMKTISRAVNSSKMKGKRAIDKVDKIMERTVTKRMSHEFEPKTDETNNALLHRVKLLEEQNAELIEKNEILTEKCVQLVTENEMLKRSAQEAKMKWRKECWTLQDEQEWQHSKRIRLDEQDLIRSPLREHLENVQTSYENNNQWLKIDKVPFSLRYPSHWQRAKDLDERDRALEEGTKAPPSTPAIAQADMFTLNSSQKRTQFSAFKKRLEMMDPNKKFKRGDKTPLPY